jgi:dTDP-4-amino-4,6-dideoxygalactose transaminase
MNELQAAMGLCNLESIEKHVERKKKIYEHYKKRLNSTEVRFQKIVASKYNYSYMPLCCENSEKKERLLLELLKIGIKPRQYFYPLTVNYAYFNHNRDHVADRNNLKNAIDVSRQVLCLPSYPSLDMKIIDTIIDLANSVLEDT